MYTVQVKRTTGARQCTLLPGKDQQELGSAHCAVKGPTGARPVQTVASEGPMDRQ